MAGAGVGNGVDVGIGVGAGAEVGVGSNACVRVGAAVEVASGAGVGTLVATEVPEGSVGAGISVAMLVGAELGSGEATVGGSAWPQPKPDIANTTKNPAATSRFIASPKCPNEIENHGASYAEPSWAWTSPAAMKHLALIGDPCQGVFSPLLASPSARF